LRCSSCDYLVPDSTDVFSCPACGASLDSPAPTAPPPGIPFERRERLGFLPALVETVRQSLFAPSDFFSRLSPEGPLGPPLLYFVCMSAIGGLSLLLYQSMITSLGLWLPNWEDRAGAAFENFTRLATLPITLPTLVAWMILWLFLQAAVIHLMLLLVGGQAHGFTATFRALSYTSGAQLFQILPLCGWVIGPIWQMVISIIGLAEVHGIGRGRAALAYFLPTVFCCGMVAASIAAVAFLIALALGAPWAQKPV